MQTFYLLTTASPTAVTQPTLSYKPCLSGNLSKWSWKSSVPLDTEISYLSRNDCIKQSPGRAGPSHSLFGKRRSTASGLSLLPHRQENTSMLLLPLLPVLCPCPCWFITLEILEELHLLLCFCWMAVGETRAAKAL